MKCPKIKKSEFQLVGLCGIFIAMKMEEIITICSEDLLYCTSNVFTKDQLLQMETRMASACNWRFTPLTLNHWLNLMTSNWDMFAAC